MARSVADYRMRKVLGVCVDCSNNAIPGQVKCVECARKNVEMHRRQRAEARYEFQRRRQGVV